VAPRFLEKICGLRKKQPHSPSFNSHTSKSSHVSRQLAQYQTAVVTTVNRFNKRNTAITGQSYQSKVHIDSQNTPLPLLFTIILNVPSQVTLAEFCLPLQNSTAASDNRHKNSGMQSRAPVRDFTFWSNVVIHLLHPQNVRECEAKENIGTFGVTGRRRKLHSEQLHTIHTLPHIRMMKLILYGHGL
jgi:hypothetical protein